MAGTLYVVPTPIGDAEDLSPRARRVLGSVAVVAAEDTRVTRALLDAVGIQGPRLVSNHDHNESRRAERFVQRLLDGEDVALVSDAGTPLVSDPGYRLVVAAIEAGVPVVPLPGPNAVTTALSASGLPTDRFVFLGFLPRATGKRRAALRERRHEPATLIWFVAPHRAIEVLGQIEEELGDRRACLARSLTKERFEELLRGPLSRIRETLETEERVLGELTLVVEGYHGASGDAARETAFAIADALVAAGVAPGVVRDALAGPLDVSRRDLYQRALSAQEEEP